MIVTRAVTLSKQVMGVVVQSLNYCPVTFLGSVTFSVTPIQRLQNKCSVGPGEGAQKGWAVDILLYVTSSAAGA